jgi:hypothetical protein
VNRHDVFGLEIRITDSGSTTINYTKGRAPIDYLYTKTTADYEYNLVLNCNNGSPNVFLEPLTSEIGFWGPDTVKIGGSVTLGPVDLGGDYQGKWEGFAWMKTGAIGLCSNSKKNSSNQMFFQEIQVFIDIYAVEKVALGVGFFWNPEFDFEFSRILMSRVAVTWKASCCCEESIEKLSEIKFK